jgi:hypothetical protein
MNKIIDRILYGWAVCFPYLFSVGTTILIGYKSVSSIIVNVELMIIGMYLSGLISEKLHKTK